MVALLDLWLPILLSAVFVFIVSSVIHMATPMHKSDFKKLPGEEDVSASLRSQNLVPGSYMFPMASSMKDMGSPEHIEKMNRGPVGYMTVLPNGPWNMGKSLGQWFAFSLLIGVFAAYVGSLTLAAGTEYMLVFRVTGTVALLGYGVSNFTDSIWKGVSWGTTTRFLVDGLIYGLVTGGTFGWLWPGVA